MIMFSRVENEISLSYRLAVRMTFFCSISVALMRYLDSCVRSGYCALYPFIPSNTNSCDQGKSNVTTGMPSDWDSMIVNGAASYRLGCRSTFTCFARLNSSLSLGRKPSFLTKRDKFLLFI